MSADYTRGEQLFNLGRYNDAIKSFKETLSEEPDSFYAKYYLALCYYNLDDIESLKDTAKSLLSDYPDNDESYYINSIYFSLTDKYDKAIEYIDKAIEIDPYEAVYFGQKSINLLNKKKFEQALYFADEGLKIDPKNTVCLNMRTKALTKLNRKEEAHETLQNTLSDNPEDYFTHANAGWTNLELGNHKQANIHFKEALQKDPNDEYARQGMLESIKAKNFIYRSFLKYAFWIENKSSNYRWGFFIGLYLIYRFSRKLIGNLGFNFLIPIIAILYLVFVLGSWIITPTSNAILLFNDYSKYLLNKKDKNGAVAFILLLSLALLTIIVYYTTNSNYFLLIAISSLCAIIPITDSLQNTDNPLKNLGFWYGFVIFSFGIINLIIPDKINILFPIGMFVLYTWLHSFLNLKK